MQYSSGFYGDSLRRLKKNKMAMFCAGILVLLVLVAIFAPVIAPYDPTYQDYSAVLAEPSMAHPFGTDEYGRDILSRIIYGSRVSLSIGIVAQVVGFSCRRYPGRCCRLLRRPYRQCDLPYYGNFPGIPGSDLCHGDHDLPGKGVLNLFIALGLLTWVRTARMIRGSVMQLKEKEYIEASRACGASTFWIITKGLVPNCLSTIIVLVTLGIPNAIMYEASLSFLGIGIQPPTPSWGNMISAAQTFISYRPVYSIMPGVAIMITVIAFNIFGDGLRDALDPKLKTDEGGPNGR